MSRKVVETLPVELTTIGEGVAVILFNEFVSRVREIHEKNQSLVSGPAYQSKDGVLKSVLTMKIEMSVEPSGFVTFGVSADAKFPSWMGRATTAKIDGDVVVHDVEHATQMSFFQGKEN